MLLGFSTVAFRYSLVGINELAKYAADVGFEGIELWSPHLNMCGEGWLTTAKKWRDVLNSFELKTTMISIDTDLVTSNRSYQDSLKMIEKAILQCDHVGCRTIRIFTGPPSSSKASEEQWWNCCERLLALAELGNKHGVRFAVETHPYTLMDTEFGVDRILNEVKNPSIGLNFDVYHLWQTGGDIVSLLDKYLHRIFHFHLKNSSTSRLSTFSREKVYNPYSSINKVCNLENGSIDYQEFCSKLHSEFDGPASVEWFGHHPFKNCAIDLAFLKKCKQSICID